MKRLLPALILFAVVGSGWWWARKSDIQRNWKTLPGGGEVRLVHASQGSRHQYLEPPQPPPHWLERLREAMHTRSTAPLRNPPTGSSQNTLHIGPYTGAPTLGVWLEWRHVPPRAQKHEAELIVSENEIFHEKAGPLSYTAANSHTLGIFRYIPMRPKTLRYAFHFNGQLVQFEFANPAYRADLPVWKGIPLPQTQQQGDLALTLHALNPYPLAYAPENRSYEQWQMRPVWAVSKAGQPATAWYTLGVSVEDPSGQSRACGLPSEPVWKVRCKLSRTNLYPYREDEIHWLGTVGPDPPHEPTSRLFTPDPQSQSAGLKFACVLGSGEYEYRDGAIASAAALKGSHEKAPAIGENPQTKAIHISLDQPALIVFGPASLLIRNSIIARDAEGNPTEINPRKAHNSPTAGAGAIIVLPAISCRIGTVTLPQPDAENFEFLVSSPDQPRFNHAPAR